MRGATHEPPPSYLRPQSGAAATTGGMRGPLVRKAALLVVSLALAGALVASFPRWNAASATAMWRSPRGSGSGGFTCSMLRPAGSPSTRAALPSATNPACRFDYRGPLRPESLDCFAEYFPFGQPFSFPEMTTAPGRRFSLSGVEWADATVPRVPIFVLFKDRVSVLMETLRSFYRYIGTPYEVRGR
jgi:hypothetical protein